MQISPVSAEIVSQTAAASRNRLWVLHPDHPTIVIPETRDAESSGIYFLQWFQVDPGSAPLRGLSGMTLWEVGEGPSL
jgi:hypothetical protein